MICSDDMTNVLRINKLTFVLMIVSYSSLCPCTYVKYVEG